MKDRFGHLQDEGEEKTQDEELRGGTERRDEQYSEDFAEGQREVRENIIEENEEKRERELRRDKDLENRDTSVGVTDIDEAITYEFDENFDFHVKQNDKRIEVPVIWDNQERWTWARQRQNLKSIKDKVLLPLIVIDRTDVSEDQSLTTIPGTSFLNSSGRTFTVRQRYSKRNRYDRFSVLQNQKPEREYYASPVPRYIEATYDVTIYMEYWWQMDPVTDLIQFNTFDYWGNEDEGKLFYTTVDSVNTESQMSGEARYIQADVSLNSQGYIVPEYLQDEEPSVRKRSAPSKIKFSEEVSDDLN